MIAQKLKSKAIAFIQSADDSMALTKTYSAHIQLVNDFINGLELVQGTKHEEQYISDYEKFDNAFYNHISKIKDSDSSNAKSDIVELIESLELIDDSFVNESELKEIQELVETLRLTLDFI